MASLMAATSSVRILLRSSHSFFFVAHCDARFARNACVSLNSAVVSSISSSVVTTDVALPMTQAASTVEHLSLAILGGEPDPFWAEIMLKTQRVVDAVQKSWQEDGRKVLVEPLAAKM